MANKIQLELDFDVSKALSELDIFTNSAKKNASNVGFDNLQKSVDSASNSLKEINLKTSSFSTSVEDVAKFIGGVTSGFILFSNQINTSASVLGILSNRISDFQNKLPAFVNATKAGDALKTSINGVSNSLIGAEKALVTSTTGLAKLGDSAIFGSKSIFGLQLILAGISGVTASASLALSGLEGTTARVARATLILVSVFTGALAVGIAQAIIIVGDYISAVGTLLVNANKSAVDSFSKLEKSTLVFERTLNNFNKAFNNSAGSIEFWNRELERIGEIGRVTPDVMQKIGAEVIAVGTNLGLSRDQMVQLTEATVDFAKGAGKDAFDTSVAFLQAINGNTQSVVSYGVKLSEANLQQFALKKGLDINIDKMSEAQKVQLRYNSIIDQYNRNAKGQAQAVSGTLIGAQDRLNFVLAKVAQEYGRGAALIENWNIATFAAGAAVESINTKVFSAIGFIGALSGRVLQIGGFFLEWSFKILGLIKVLSLLDGAVQTGVFQNLLTKNIPLINASIIELIKNTGASFVSFKSLNDILKTTGSLIVAFTKNIIATGLGVSSATAATSSFTTILSSGLVNALRLVSTGVLKLGTALISLSLNPIVLGIAAFSAALFVLYKAFSLIEEKTGIFSDSLNSIIKSFTALSPLGDLISNIFSKIAQSIFDLVSKGFGLLVFSISKTIVGIKDLINDISLFKSAFAGTKETDKQINKLDELSSQLKSVGFDFRKLPKDVEKSTNDIIKHLDKEEVFNALKKIREELKTVGISDVQILKQQHKDRIDALQNALQLGFVKEKEFGQLSLKINQDFQNKISEIHKKETEERAKLQNKEAERIEKLSTLNLKGLQGNFNINVVLPKDTEGQIALAVGGLNKALEGAKGATDLIASGAGAIANTFLPGIGAAVQQMVSVLAQGPQAVANLVNSFIQQIPVVIQNVILAIPAVIQAFIDGLPAFINALVAAIPDIILGLVNAVPQLIFSIIDNIPIIIQNLADQIPIVVERLATEAPRIITEIIARIPEIISALVAKIPSIAIQFGTSLAAQTPYIATQFAIEFVKQIPTIAAEFVKAIPKAIGGGVSSIGGALGGVVGGIGKIFGFADGGGVQLPKGDTLLAGFNASETVINERQTQRFNQLLDRIEARTDQPVAQQQSDNRPLIINLQVGEKQLADVILNLNRNGFRLA